MEELVLFAQGVDPPSFGLGRGHVTYDTLHTWQRRYGYDSKGTDLLGVLG